MGWYSEIVTEESKLLVFLTVYKAYFEFIWEYRKSYNRSRPLLGAALK